MLTEEVEITAAEQELEKWKAKVKEAEDKKSRRILEKLDSEALKKKFHKETLNIIALQQEKETEYVKKKEELQARVSDLEKSNRVLMDQIAEYEQMLKMKKAENTLLQQQLKIMIDVPEKDVKFTSVLTQENKTREDYESIESQFTITQKPCLPLKAGQALITFEEDTVAEKILMLPKCSVSFDDNKMNVKPVSVSLEPSVKFQINFCISKKKIQFSNVPAVLDEEHMKDRLKLSFSKPSLGGGEVEELEYNKNTGTGQVTFLNTGVAERLCLKGRYPIDMGKMIHVYIQPYFEYQLKQFQTFCGVSKRTVLLNDVKDALDEEDMQDHLEIHFQKPSNFGGEVETIKYTSKGGVMAYFSEDIPRPEA